MIKNRSQSFFPSDTESDAVKASKDFGKHVARAIETEWVGRGNTGRYHSGNREFHNRRLYARGEQSVAKYKSEFAVNGDLSYMNLDWSPVPIIPKFVDIVVNGMSQRALSIKAFAQDPIAQQRRIEKIQNLLTDMRYKDLIAEMSQATGVNLFSVPNHNDVPSSEEELEVRMQIEYKPSFEIAHETLIETVLTANKYDEVRKRFLQDLTILGIGVCKTDFNKAEGIKVEYVDPADFIYSPTEDPNFEDVKYCGEVKRMGISELYKRFPDMTEKELESLEGGGNVTPNSSSNDFEKEQVVDVLFFEYKTYLKQVYKIKKTDSGLEKVIIKDDTFDPPSNDNFSKAERVIEVIYRGAKVIDKDIMLEWELADNMIRPNSNMQKVRFSYNASAPRMYKGKIESLVSRMIKFADMIQITHLKMQQVISKMVPDGVYLDVDGLTQIDLGNGTNYNPAEALNMYFQTGSVVGRSMTSEGEFNHGKMPIQELQSSSGQAKIQSLIATYQYYLQMIRDVTGLNEARDGSTPDKNSLVGLQKMAAANSNVATRHILQSACFLTVSNAENISLRINDCLEFPLLRDALVGSLNSVSVGMFSENSESLPRDYGIFLELEPDEDEKQVVEQTIQMALQSQSIELEDAIEIRNIKNTKLANQYLKIRKKKKVAQDQAIAERNIKKQSEANAEAAERSAQAEMQKNQALTESQIQVEQMKAQLAEKKMMLEADLKKQLMQLEYDFSTNLEKAKAEAKRGEETTKEDRKDERTKIQASQQSELIEQRTKGGPPKKFESAGMDNMSGFGLEQFEPK